MLEFLIRSTWLDNEAGEQDIKVTDKDVQKKLDEAKKSLGNEKAYQQFLARAGPDERRRLLPAAQQLLEQKITAKVTKGKDKVTDAQVQQYYEKNKSRFAQPERRDLRIVLTKTKAKADAAKAALAGGQSWSAVAKQYSIDQQSKNSGGKLPGRLAGLAGEGVRHGDLQGEKGQTVGPVKTQFGYYVFEVTKITPKDQQSLRESSASIKQILAQENQRKALESFGKDYRERWKNATKCRDAYVTQDCDNAPKQKAQTTTTPTQTATETQPAQLARRRRRRLGRCPSPTSPPPSPVSTP